MIKINQLRWLSLMALMIFQSCAYAPPIQEMSDARQAIRAAREIGADHYFPKMMQQIDEQIDNAEKKLELADYEGAAKLALIAKNNAIKIRNFVLNLIKIKDIIAQVEKKIIDLPSHVLFIFKQILEAVLKNDENLLTG